MKKICLVLLVLMLFIIPSCKEKYDENIINIIALKGPTGMGMAKLIDDSENGKTKSNYNVSLAANPDEITANVIKGTVDIAAVPINLASVLYQKTDGEYQIAAINTLGVMYIIENGNTINDLTDLNGKTIYATGQGSMPEYILNYLLEKNNINAEIIYKNEHSELASLITAGEINIGLLPEPYVTTVINHNNAIRIAVDITEEWNKISPEGIDLPQGCIIIKKTFADSNKNLINIFMSEYKASINYVNHNIEEAAELISKYGIISDAEIVKKAIPNCNIVFIDGDEMKKNTIDIMNIFYSANPSSIGGIMPDDEFFYKP